ncbi:COP1-interactive protein 1 [Argentina anserina]|uniref:COP1-interactive protein 1 n=1 Tax=Argentina anserina TaxID=57926 RepID=UPI00217687AA|nr:COP1-interactive protein 1 [Potentilla anserina]XP_050376724.1 COP1-interactive protein 1 [Potentilla anserina]
MSRIAKWKLEKTKVKVVFRLQFNATHIPQSGWDKLFISFIPADSGKATAKTTKANVRNGTCKWGDPIYETTRLLQDTKTKKFDEKLYKLVVTMGSSRSSVLGETNINLADYADASKPSAVALPLQGCDSGTILHVTVQLLTSKTGFREFEQQRELRESGLCTTSDQSRNDVSTAKRISSSEDTVNARVRFREELSPLEEDIGRNEEYPDSTVGFDGSSNTSESLYAEKHDTSSTHEIDSLKSTTSGDLGGLSLGQSPRKDKGDPSDQRFLAQGTSEWAHSWASDYSGDVDLPNAYEENSRLRGSLEEAESSILELKQEVSSLQSQADEIGVKAQKFSLQLDAEISSGKQLAKEVSVLRSECSKLKEDLDERKNTRLRIPFTSREAIETGQDDFLHELQLRWLKGLGDMEDKIRELQTKATIGAHERDFRSFHSDLEALVGALQDLKPVTGQAILGMNKGSTKETNAMNVHKDEQLALGTSFDADFYPEGMFHSLSMPGLVSQEFDSLDATNAIKSKLFELLRELDELKAERESLAKKADQMECYYEALIHELEENQRQMLGELQSLRNEHSTCLYTISSAKAEMERIQLDMSNEIIKFSKERHDLDALTKELERRASTAEAALKRARLNYSIAVDHLQKDLELLSSQVLSMHETNENLIKQAFADSVLPSFQGREVMIRNPKRETETFHAEKHKQHPKQSNGVKRQHLDGDILSDDLRRSLLLQKETYQKVEEEVYEVHLVNVYLDIFSKTLEVTLIEASADFGLLKERVLELTQQLEFSTESKELLILRLQTALDEIHCLNEDKDIWASKCSDLTLKNQNLEQNFRTAINECKDTCNSKCNDLTLKNHSMEVELQNLTRETDLQAQKIAEWEDLLKEYETYESKYKDCSAEKLELANLLERQTLENKNLQNRLSSLEEELKAVRNDWRELAYAKEGLQNIVNSSQGKLRNLLASYDEKYEGLSLPLCHEYNYQDLESRDLTVVVDQIEELQHNVYEKIVLLMEEKNNLVQERDIAQMSLRAADSDNMIMKQKFERDLLGMVDKLDVSNALVQNLQLQVGAVANKLQISSEVEERYAQQHKELLIDLDQLEMELQQISSKYQDLVEEIMALETVTDELERCKLTIAALTEEQEALLASLQDKTEESFKLSMEVNSLQGSLLSSHDELHIEKNHRDKLESAVSDLTAQLNEKYSQFLNFDHQKDELVHLKQLLSESELEKSRVCGLLLDTEKCLNDAHEECCSISALEAQLSEMFEFSIAADIVLAFTKAQYETKIEELDQKLQFSGSCLSELRDNHLGVENMLNRCLASERHLVEANTKLMARLSDAAEECSLISVLEAQLSEMHEISIAADVGLTFAEAQYEARIEELGQKLHSSDIHLSELRNNQLDVENKLNDCLTSERHYIEENTKLMTSLSSLMSDLEASIAQNRILLDTNSSLRTELEACKQRAENSKAQYESRIEELDQKLHSSDSHLSVLHNNHLHAENKLNEFLANERHYIEENTKLMTSLSSLNSELEASIAQNRILLDTNSSMRSELEEYKKRAENAVAIDHVDRSQCALENEKLEHISVISEEEIDNLIFSKEELEINHVVLKAKLDEQYMQITSLEAYKDEMTLMHNNECNDLKQRLAQQVVKAEEFKNLSIHFKELKDKSCVECLHMPDKRELEVPLAAMHESLRIAFIKEQYEIKLQELNQQLVISKKHCEEMLWKLQDAINEVDNRKKSEATHVKRNEELGMRILELESELQSLLSERREIMKAYDLMKAEKECSLISLDCCKEEKQELEASLQKCNEEKVQITLELTSAKDLLQSSSPSNQREGNEKLHKEYSISNETAGPECLSSIDEPEKDDILSRGINGIPSALPSKQTDVLNSDMKHLVLANNQFRSQNLRSSMENLNKELERMKHENLLPLDDHHHDSDFPGLQRDLMQLNKVNEELGSIFPLFNKYSCSGNAIERVLALEIELAEALQAKKKSAFQFQSSFLKQHDDEEAVFHSFRDINELIKDMLEVKGRYATVETELKEMHDRYSQLSLQFAEVEGERQKLLMTLKNVRASKKALYLNRSSTTTILDP